MTIMDIALATEGGKWRHRGNYIFVVRADVANIYEVATYENLEPKTVKDLNKTLLVTSGDTWDTLADRFLGAPQAPNFTKVLTQA